MLKIFRYISLVSVLLYCIGISGQNLSSDLSKEINTIRTKKNSSMNDQLLLKYNNKELLDSLLRFDKDSLLNVRFNIQLLEYKIALNNPLDTSIRKEVTNRLIHGINDPEALIRQNAINKLLTFSSLDFDKKAINSLNKILKENNLTKDLILLIGVANIQEQKEYLLKKLKPFPLNSLSDFYTPDWAMHLALARMGNSECIKYCINGVESFTDEIPKITLLLKDVGYIRSEDAVEYLRKYLYNTNRLPSVKETTEGSQYCQYALDVLANILKDFPIESKGIGYTDEEIDVARNWMKSHSQYKIKR
jgi:hypothetical protein